MKIFFARHAETEHNVAGLLAGVTDSVLTNHGVLQTQRLGSHLAGRDLRFTQIYASDLQRARMTAQAIAEAQREKSPELVPEVVQLHLLREKDFGSLECIPWTSKRVQNASEPRIPDPSDPAFKPKETSEAMAKRAAEFLDDFVIPLFATDEEEENTVAVVSHGLFLSVLWRSFLARFGPNSVSLAPEAGNTFGVSQLDNIVSWANTGYLEGHVRPKAGWVGAKVSSYSLDPSSPTATSLPPMLLGYNMLVKAINSSEHLRNLKRTGGGLGSATYDARQKNIDGFFKKPKPNPGGAK